MNFIIRSAGIICLIFIVLLITGCAKHAPVAGSAAPAAEPTPPPPALTEQEMKKTVVARVNGVDINMDALVKMTDTMSATIAPPRAEPPEETRKKALDQLIFLELALQEASRQKMRVLEREINRAVAGLKVHDQSNLDDYLTSHHLTLEELRAQIRRNLLLERIFEREVREKVSIPEEDIRKEYEGHRERYATPEKPMTYEEARSIIEGKLRAIAQQKRRLEWEQELKKDAKIEIMEEAAGSQQSGAGSRKPDGGKD
jgi:hypothetical protein